MKLNIKDLTEEQIKDLELQLQKYRKPKEPHYTDVKSWEDAFMVVKPEWYITSDANINLAFNIHSAEHKKCFNNIPTPLHAKSILATCKLMVIADALNEGWKPDWKNGSETKWAIRSVKSNLLIDSCFMNHSGIIHFKSEKIAEYAMKQFEQLFLDMLMIER